VLRPGSILVGKEGNGRSCQQNDIENIISGSRSYAPYSETVRYSSKVEMRALRSRGQRRNGSLKMCVWRSKGHGRYAGEHAASPAECYLIYTMICGIQARTDFLCSSLVSKQHPSHTQIQFSAGIEIIFLQDSNMPTCQTV
jgi:hypothetical protein